MSCDTHLIIFSQNFIHFKQFNNLTDFVITLQDTHKHVVMISDFYFFLAKYVTNILPTGKLLLTHDGPAGGFRSAQTKMCLRPEAQVFFLKKLTISGAFSEFSWQELAAGQGGRGPEGDDSKSNVQLKGLNIQQVVIVWGMGKGGEKSCESLRQEWHSLNKICSEICQSKSFWRKKQRKHCRITNKQTWHCIFLSDYYYN